MTSLDAVSINSDSRGFFSPSPHTTRHAGPHRAVPKERRAVASHFQSQFFEKTAVTVIIWGAKFS